MAMSRLLTKEAEQRLCYQEAASLKIRVNTCIFLLVSSTFNYQNIFGFDWNFLTC